MCWSNGSIGVEFVVIAAVGVATVRVATIANATVGGIIDGIGAVDDVRCRWRFGHSVGAMGAVSVGAVGLKLSGFDLSWPRDGNGFCWR